MPGASLMEELRQLWRMRALLAVMTRRELAARTAGAAGGLLWLWAPPLLTVAAYFLIFDVVFGMRLGAHAPTDRVGTFLVVGVLAWSAFADVTQRAMMSLVDAGGMLQKNPLPPVLFPARAALASAAVFVPLLVLLVLLYAPMHHFRLAVLGVAAMAAAQLVLGFLLGYLLAIMAAALRDVIQLVGVLLSLGVFLSPILFPLTMFPERWRPLLWLNPMTAPVLGYQSALLRGEWPPLAVWAVIGVWMLLLTLALGVAVQRSRDQLVDWL